MKFLYEKFSASIAWNGLESVIANSALLIHQFILFKILGSHTYGIVGSTFSCIYLSIAFLNFGFDESLGWLYTTATQSKTQFRRLIVWQVIPLIIFLASSPLLFFVLHQIKSPLGAFSLDPITVLVISAIILFEGLKKSCRSILHLAFASRQTAFVELLTILGYMGTVWFLYGLGYGLTLLLLLLPLLATAIMGTLILGTYIMQLYKSLPETSPHQSLPGMTGRVLKNRFFAYLIQINHLIFSGNFLVPFFAIRFGLEYAGFLKLVTHCVYAMSTIIHQTFGNSAVALLAHSKHLPLNEKRQAFSLATNSLHQALYAITLFFIINIKPLLTRTAAASYYWPLVLIVILLHFSEHLFTMYEKFYITEEKGHYILAVNVITSITLYVLYALLIFSPLITLLCIGLTRCISFVCINILSDYLWNIKPKWRVHPLPIISSLIISLTVFFLIR